MAATKGGAPHEDVGKVRHTFAMVSALLSVTFACGVIIAVAHVVNTRFVAPVYDVVANLVAFACAVSASILLGHWAPASFAGLAIVCWLILARRTFLARRGPTGPAPGES